MTPTEALVAPLERVAATILNPASILSVWSVAAALALAFVWLAQRSLRLRGRLRARALLRALLSRRQLRSRSTRADALYALASLAMLGAIIGWAVISTNWVSEGVVALLARRFGPPADPAPDIWRNAARTLALFLAYDIGFFVDHTLKHRIPALWELHKVHHAAETLTPLVNFRVHPLDALMLANMLALFIGVGGGVATYMLGPRATSFLLFDDNVLMILYIFLTAQLQHSEIWIPFTGLWGRFLMSPAHHQLHHSSDPAHFNCNLGASLALWDWLAGSLRTPSIESPRLKFGASGFVNDPHGVAGFLIEPTVRFAVSLWRGWRRLEAGSSTPGLRRKRDVS
jgi:sterol desaturase/sphingolipid hydroxylase (fatty acid hydroxylase superfamily)